MKYTKYTNVTENLQRCTSPKAIFAQLQHGWRVAQGRESLGLRYLARGV
jgi:hypothetical protein